MKNNLDKDEDDRLHPEALKILVKPSEIKVDIMNLEQNYQDVLEIITQHPDSGIGWYGLERILSILNHPISKDGILMSILKDLLENELITSVSISQHPSYVITEKAIYYAEDLKTQN